MLWSWKAKDFETADIYARDTRGLAWDFTFGNWLRGDATANTDSLLRRGGVIQTPYHPIADTCRLAG